MLPGAETATLDETLLSGLCRLWEYPLCGKDETAMPCRHPNPEDALAIARIHKLAWQAAYVGIMPDEFLSGLDEVVGADRWLKFLIDSREDALVCEREAELVGICRYGPIQDDDAKPSEMEVYALNVHPDWWSVGVGRELMRATLGQVRDKGQDSVRLWVASENQRARRFYESLGFSEDGTTRVDSNLTGVPIAETRLVLDSVLAA